MVLMVLDKDLKNKQEFYENEVNKLIEAIQTPENIRGQLYIHKWVLKHTKKDDYVLDVGCGHGILCYLLKKEGRYPTGVDMTKASIDFCNDKIIGVKFTQSPAEQLPFQDSLFDIVASNQLIEHLPEPKLAIKEMIRVCKPNGKLLITTPILDYMGGREVGHLHSFDYYKIMDLFKEFGDDFKVYWLSKFIQYNNQHQPNPKNIFGVIFNVRKNSRSN